LGAAAMTLSAIAVLEPVIHVVIAVTIVVKKFAIFGITH
jgi:hypothetical protein